MSLKKFVVISEMSGVHAMIGNRANGLIVENFDTGKRKFVSSRKHQFTPLESISIYTEDNNTVALFDVFKTMQEKMEECPLPTSGNKMTSDEAFGYLGQILPNYDRDQVYFNDVKKLVKWFSYLNDRNLLDFTEEETEENKEEAPSEE